MLYYINSSIQRNISKSKKNKFYFQVLLESTIVLAIHQECTAIHQRQTLQRTVSSQVAATSHKIAFNQLVLSDRTPTPRPSSRTWNWLDSARSQWVRWTCQWTALLAIDQSTWTRMRISIMSEPRRDSSIGTRTSAIQRTTNQKVILPCFFIVFLEDLATHKIFSVRFIRGNIYLIKWRRVS